MDNLSKLSNRHIEVLELMAEGLTNLEIGNRLNLGKRSVEGIRKVLINMTSTKNSVHLIVYALRNNLIK